MFFMKKLFKALLCIIAVLLIAVAVIWNGELRTLAGIKQVGDDPYLFSCEYEARYDLDALVEAGIDENAKLVSFIIGKLSRGLYKPAPAEETAASPFSCTSFQARNAEGEGFLFGRNYDFFKNPSLVLTSHPRDGYASISTCDLSHLGYGLDKLPVKFVSRALCLAAIYAPMDGMNEKGFCVSVMAIPKQPARQDTGNPIVGTSIYMRLLLDRCATVEEALELTSRLDIRHDQKAGAGYHFMICDASGDAAVIEFDKNDGWKTMVVRKSPDSDWMHVTNHLLSPKYYTTEPDPAVGNPHSRSWWRYATVAEYLGSREGVITADEAQECLSEVHWKDLVWDNGNVEDTQWSNVYDQSALTLRLRNWNDYEKTVNFAL